VAWGLANTFLGRILLRFEEWLKSFSSNDLK
jgi:hypothetical protein